MPVLCLARLLSTAQDSLLHVVRFTGTKSFSSPGCGQKRREAGGASLSSCSLLLEVVVVVGHSLPTERVFVYLRSLHILHARDNNWSLSWHVTPTLDPEAVLTKPVSLHVWVAPLLF